MDNNTYTIAVLEAKDGKLDQLIEELKKLAEATRQEEGALEYGFYQDRSNPNTIISYEQWKDTTAEESHWKTPHLNAAFSVFKEALAKEPSVFKGPKII